MTLEQQLQKFDREILSTKQALRFYEQKEKSSKAKSSASCERSEPIGSVSAVGCWSTFCENRNSCPMTKCRNC